MNDMMVIDMEKAMCLSLLCYLELHVSINQIIVAESIAESKQAPP